MRETTDGLDGGNRPAIGEARTPYLRRLLRWRLPLLGGTILVLAVLGPFGTFRDLGFAGRLAYWGGLILLGCLLFEASVQVGRRLMRRRPHAWRALLAGVVLVVAAVQTLVVALLEHALRGLDYITPAGLAEMFVYVLVVTVVVSAVPVWLELRDRGLVGMGPGGTGSGGMEPVATELAQSPQAPADRAATGAAVAAPSSPPFLDRIPARLGRDVLALEMEDHYVRVHTAQGSDLILMRLRDAVAELSGLDGLQVHRSYWVSAAAVDGVERKPDGKLILVLSNGMRVPVSRSHAATVRAAGWAGRG